MYITVHEFIELMVYKYKRGETIPQIGDPNSGKLKYTYIYFQEISLISLNNNNTMLTLTHYLYMHTIDTM